jgi:hypothetical protein
VECVWLAEWIWWDLQCDLVGSVGSDGVWRQTGVICGGIIGFHQTPPHSTPACGITPVANAENGHTAPSLCLICMACGPIGCCLSRRLVDQLHLCLPVESLLSVAATSEASVFYDPFGWCLGLLIWWRGIAPGGTARHLASIEQEPAHSASPKEKKPKSFR